MASGHVPDRQAHLQSGSGGVDQQRPCSCFSGQFAAKIFYGYFFKTKNHVLTEDTKLKITINDSLDPGNVVYDFGVDPILICFPTINGTPGHYSSHKPLLGLII